MDKMSRKVMNLLVFLVDFFWKIFVGLVNISVELYDREGLYIPFEEQQDVCESKHKLASVTSVASLMFTFST